MIEQLIECDDRKLLLVLRGDESPPPGALVEHVESCVRCRERLAELAATQEYWQKTAIALSNGKSDPLALGSRLPESVSAEFAVRAERPIVWNDSMVKQLLEPPTHPEMLGRLGRYEVERLIGSGGMGIVFKAFDTELNRPVAIKLLAPYLASNGSARQRFAREARSAAGVVDDHVVPIFNVESENEPPFLVMQYIAGGSLQERLGRDGPLSVSEILRIGLQASRGLAAAHAQGLIHRDIKPSNILLDESVERALLTDFGLARAEDDACLTRSGFHPGTPHYMSPEQVRGEAIDARSDLFGLGCVLYALCTGHPPFRADSGYAVLRRITDESQRPIREINVDIPEWLEHIVTRLLSKSPDDRYASAEEVADLLEDCLAHIRQPSVIPVPASLVPHPTVKATGSSNGWDFWGSASNRRLIGGLGGFLFLIAAITIIWIETNKGTIIIESDLDNVPVVIEKKGEVYRELEVDRTGTSIGVHAGEYEITFAGGLDQFTVDRDTVNLQRGQEAVVRIRATRRAADDSLNDRNDKELSKAFLGSPPLQFQSVYNENVKRFQFKLERVDVHATETPEEFSVRLRDSEGLEPIGVWGDPNADTLTIVASAEDEEAIRRVLAKMEAMAAMTPTLESQREHLLDERKRLIRDITNLELHWVDAKKHDLGKQKEVLRLRLDDFQEQLDTLDEKIEALNRRLVNSEVPGSDFDTERRIEKSDWLISWDVVDNGNFGFKRKATLKIYRDGRVVWEGESKSENDSNSTFETTYAKEQVVRLARQLKRYATKRASLLMPNDPAEQGTGYSLSDYRELKELAARTADPLPRVLSDGSAQRIEIRDGDDFYDVMLVSETDPGATHVSIKDIGTNPHEAFRLMREFYRFTQDARTDEIDLLLNRFEREESNAAAGKGPGGLDLTVSANAARLETVSGEQLAQNDETFQVFFQQPSHARAILTTLGNEEIVFPKRVNLEAGRIYHLTLSNLQSQQGIQLDGSVELKSVNPQSRSFLRYNAVPFRITSDDISHCASNGLLEKAVYLPSEGSANPGLVALQTLASQRMEAGVDAVAEAQRRGTLIAVLRLRRSTDSNPSQGIRNDEKAHNRTHPSDVVPKRVDGAEQ